MDDWLETLFGEKGVPNFERNKDTIGILEEIFKMNQMRKKEVEIVIADLLVKKEEYQEEGNNFFFFFFAPF
jgi:uncharacterized protein with ParB-like and HNH nuclease domain